MHVSLAKATNPSMLCASWSFVNSDLSKERSHVAITKLEKKVGRLGASDLNGLLAGRGFSPLHYDPQLGEGKSLMFQFRTQGSQRSATILHAAVNSVASQAVSFRTPAGRGNRESYCLSFPSCKCLGGRRLATV